MAIAYKSFQSILPTKEGEKLFYPRVVLTGSVTTDDIAKEIAELSSLTTGDTKNVIDNLVYVLTRHLHASESVMLDGFGSFRPVLKVLKKRGVKSASEVSASQSSLHIRFLPASSASTWRRAATAAAVTVAAPRAATTKAATRWDDWGIES